MFDERGGAAAPWRSLAVPLLATATLSLGIGGVTAMYSFVSAVLVAPLPYPEPETLVVVTRNNRRQGFAGLMLPARDVEAFREQARSFSALSGYTTERVTLTGSGAPEDVRAVRILPGFLDLLGMAPSVGRRFELREHETDAPVALLGHGLWQRRFGARSDVVGQSFHVDGEERVVVGVLPEDRDIASGFDLVLPWSEADLRDDAGAFVWVAGRLAPELTARTANDELDEILRRWEEEHRPPVSGWRVDVEPVREHVVGDVRRPLLVLFGAVVVGVTPGYFDALGLPLVRGRALAIDDARDEDGVVLVNRRFAERAWPGDDPLGKRLKFGGTESTHPWFSVVGVVEDAQLVGLAVANQEGVFRPLLRTGRTLSALQVLVRAYGNGRAEQLMPQIRDAVWDVDDQLPIGEERTMQSLLLRNVASPRFQLVVLAVFATIALALASIGIYGMLSQSVAERRREIGLRMALGANRADVLRLVVRQGAVLLGVGLLFGLGLAVSLTRLLAALLYEVSPTEPVSFLGGAAVLIGTGVLATLGPALRATRVDPMTALRSE